MATVGPTFRAEYDNKTSCPVCEEAITRGQMVHFVEDMLTHAGCDEDLMEVNPGHLVEWKLPVTDSFELVKPEAIRPVRPICPVCHMELPVSLVCGVC